MCPNKKDNSFLLTVPLEKKLLFETQLNVMLLIKGISSFQRLEVLNYNINVLILSKCLPLY